MNRALVRSTLIGAIVVLLGLLTAMSFLFVKTVNPPGVVQIPDTRMTWVRSIYGFGPSADEQFAHPYSVAIGSNGDIYATDPERARILVFGRHGAFKRIVHTGGGGTEPGMFQRPESIALDSRDNLYIADSWANKIVVFDPEGNFVREWGVPGQPRGIAADSRQVYVLGPGTVYVYSATGEELRQFGTRGKRPGQIDAYLGIAVRDGRVYIADSYNHRIQAFDTQGTLAWSSPAEAPVDVSTETSHVPDEKDLPVWDLPQDLTFDGVGNLVVADAFRFELVVVNPKNGDVLGAYGGIGTKDGEFYYPTSVAYDESRDWFVVADTQNQRLQIVRLPDTAGPSALATARRIESSPWRYVALPGLLLTMLLMFSVYKWRRWGRDGASDMSS